jgi:Fic family protein
MKVAVHTFTLGIDWPLINQISQIDRFDAEWSAIERKEGAKLRQLKHVATVSSVGASTRIEGSLMSDAEVEILLNNIAITTLDDRDSQEVAGYFDALDFIAASYPDIDVSEGNLRILHQLLLKHSSKDVWHRGNYKKQSNVVEATYPDGTKQIVFKTTEPGFPTQDAMRTLVEWYRSDKETHPLVKCALFAYDFVSIHPFQDGNGRLSRLISTLLLLQNGYRWIQYVSFEHEIERRKSEYYRVLRTCQSSRPNEDVGTWISFFFDCLITIQQKLMKKLNAEGVESGLAPREKTVLSIIETHPGIKSGELSKRMDIPGTTMKKLLTGLVERKLVVRHGIGAGTNYTVV